MIGKDIESMEETTRILIAQLNKRFDDLEDMLKENYCKKIDCYENQKTLKEKYIDPIQKKFYIGQGMMILAVFLSKYMV